MIDSKGVGSGRAGEVTLSLVHTYNELSRVASLRAEKEAIEKLQLTDPEKNPSAAAAKLNEYAYISISLGKQFVCYISICDIEVVQKSAEFGFQLMNDVAIRAKGIETGAATAALRMMHEEYGLETVWAFYAKR